VTLDAALRAVAGPPTEAIEVHAVSADG
jgi:hypothetical protein